MAPKARGARAAGPRSSRIVVGEGFVRDTRRENHEHPPSDKNGAVDQKGCRSRRLGVLFWPWLDDGEMLEGGREGRVVSGRKHAKQTSRRIGPWVPATTGGKQELARA
jgi:hypothetical protein